MSESTFVDTATTFDALPIDGVTLSSRSNSDVAVPCEPLATPDCARIKLTTCMPNLYTRRSRTIMTAPLGHKMSLAVAK